MVTEISPWETVLTIEGSLVDFVHLETVYLGSLARQTKIATNVNRVVKAAAGKPVLFFPFPLRSLFPFRLKTAMPPKLAVFPEYPRQPTLPIGTAMPLAPSPTHMIAAYAGNTLAATEAFDRHIDPSVNRVALVDFDNDCVRTALEVAKKFGPRLYGVRLDTADTLVDKSVLSKMGSFKPTGVCACLVQQRQESLR